MASPKKSTAWVMPFVIGAAAVMLGVYSLNQKPIGLASLMNQDSQTYCYQGVSTHDVELPTAKCFKVSNGVFAEVMRDTVSEITESRKGYAIPGLWDGHGHLMQYGEFLNGVDLFGSKTFDEVKERLGRYVEENPNFGTRDEWVRGAGWDQTPFGRMPTADDLRDPRFDNLYIMLDRIDVHCIWVSKPVMALLPSDIPDVDGGEIIREPGMGVFCDNAMDMIYRHFPKPDAEKKRLFIRTAMKNLNSVGLVGAHDASEFPDTLALWEQWAGVADDWTLRVYSMAECPERNTVCLDKIRKIEGDWLTVRSVKLFADGALGSWGSAMLDPYSDKPETDGSVLVKEGPLTEVTKAWSAAGFQVNIHAIGDKANRYVVNAMEASLRTLCPDEDLAICQSKHRFRIEHAQIIHPDDQERIRTMRLIPSIQPTHATSDMKYAEDRLGPERTTTEAYRMKTFLNQGLDIVLGSDFPVEPPNPFHGIYAAVTRKDPKTGQGKDGSPTGWHAGESLSVEEALSGFTTGPAYGGFMEGKAGLIKDGAWADWVVLDKPLEETDIEDFRHITVRETWVGGKMVYRRGV